MKWKPKEPKKPIPVLSCACCPSRLCSEGCGSACEGISAASPGPLAAQCGFHGGGPHARCHLPVFPGRRLTCWDSREPLCKQIRAELRFLPSCSLGAGAGSLGALAGCPEQTSTPRAEGSPTPRGLPEPAGCLLFGACWAACGSG